MKKILCRIIDAPDLAISLFSGGSLPFPPREWEGNPELLLGESPKNGREWEENPELLLGGISQEWEGMGGESRAGESQGNGRESRGIPRESRGNPKGNPKGGEWERNPKGIPRESQGESQGRGIGDGNNQPGRSFKGGIRNS